MIVEASIRKLERTGILHDDHRRGVGVRLKAVRHQHRSNQRDRLLGSRIVLAPPPSVKDETSSFDHVRRKVRSHMVMRVVRVPRLEEHDIDGPLACREQDLHHPVRVPLAHLEHTKLVRMPTEIARRLYESVLPTGCHVRHDEISSMNLRSHSFLLVLPLKSSSTRKNGTTINQMSQEPVKNLLPIFHRSLHFS